MVETRKVRIIEESKVTETKSGEDNTTNLDADDWNSEMKEIN